MRVDQTCVRSVFYCLFSWPLPCNIHTDVDFHIYVKTYVRVIISPAYPWPHHPHLSLPTITHHHPPSLTLTPPLTYPHYPSSTLTTPHNHSLTLKPPITPLPSPPPLKPLPSPTPFTPLPSPHPPPLNPLPSSPPLTPSPHPFPLTHTLITHTPPVNMIYIFIIAPYQCCNIIRPYITWYPYIIALRHYSPWIKDKMISPYVRRINTLPVTTNVATLSLTLYCPLRYDSSIDNSIADDTPTKKVVTLQMTPAQYAELSANSANSFPRDSNGLRSRKNVLHGLKYVLWLLHHVYTTLYLTTPLTSLHLSPHYTPHIATPHLTTPLTPYYTPLISLHITTFSSPHLTTPHSSHYTLTSLHPSPHYTPHLTTPLTSLHLT